MRTYKLIKWYPSLPKQWEAGMLVGRGDRHNGTYSPCDGKYESGSIILISEKEVENNPEYWLLTSITLDRAWEITEKDLDGNIKSIKRIDDECVFTIGDTFKYVTGDIDIINSFRLTSDDMTVVGDNYPGGKGYLLHDISHTDDKRSPILTTEDGVDVFKGANIYYFEINASGELHGPFSWKSVMTGGIRSNEIYFSTYEAARKHLVYSKSILSIYDVINCVDASEDYTQMIDKLRELVAKKSKEM